MLSRFASRLSFELAMALFRYLTPSIIKLTSPEFRDISRSDVLVVRSPFILKFKSFTIASISEPISV